eukprot:NODE_9124_length_232_cov_64.404372_g8509_i0.p1 GENE.NODE_9124_length_232_cov_64.404372_g8509_i0~~NODE_9124_length_232_cov_64.404372_g8509_i0.p1  ORF type:complete len:59 (+),score=10.47 NODE_9124_length_232_cov_64.404372_g8509_i0:27-179(+)
MGFGDMKSWLAHVLPRQVAVLGLFPTHAYLDFSQCATELSHKSPRSEARY